METPSDTGQIPNADAGPSQETAAQTIGLIAVGLGRFRVMSEHERRLEWEREYRSHP